MIHVIGGYLHNSIKIYSGLCTWIIKEVNKSLELHKTWAEWYLWLYPFVAVTKRTYISIFKIYMVVVMKTKKKVESKALEPLIYCFFWSNKISFFWKITYCLWPSWDMAIYNEYQWLVEKCQIELCLSSNLRK